jgi:large subunit ribosomal protein L30
MASKSSVRITQRRSANGSNPKVRATLRSLGLRRIGQTVERSDGPELRGMIRSVGHLVEVSNGSSGGNQEQSDG